MNQKKNNKEKKKSQTIQNELKSNQYLFKMPNELLYRLKVVILWLFISISYTAIASLNLMEPGIIEKYLNGEIWGEFDPGAGLIYMSVLWFAPLILAFLSVVLKDKANKIINKIFGIGYFLFISISIVTHFLEHVSSANLDIYAYSSVIMLLEVFAPILIIVFSFKKK